MFNFRRVENSGGVSSGVTRRDGSPGQAVLTTVLFLLFASIAIILSFTSIALRETRASRVDLRAKQSYFLSEAGAEDLAYRIVNSKAYGPSQNVSIDGLTAVVTVTDSGSSKIIESAGNVSSAVRKTSSSLTITTVGVGFFYGVQVGDGGLDMSNNARVNGNVYSNGNIIGAPGARITGDAIVAGGINDLPSLEWTVQNADQFFATVAGNRDIAQSFTAPASDRLNQVAVFLGKVGNPVANITVRITADNAGKPSTVSLANGTIAYTSVGLTPSWINVAFSVPPNLTAGTKYWIVLDYSANSGVNHWNWRKDSSNAYAGNTGRFTSDWDAGGAVWTDVGGDLDFRVWMGGVNTRIEDTIIGDAATGTARANLFVNANVHGAACPNPYCIISNPPRENMPISDGVIQDWRNAAADGGTCVVPQCDASGNYHITGGVAKSLGPKKITGNLQVDNNAILTITGTIYVAGSVNLSNNCIIKLDPSYGANSGVIVTDGLVDVSNNCTFQGSGNPKSYILLLTAKDAPALDVMDISNNSAGVIYYAAKGRINFANNATAKEATAYGMDMSNNAVITYESGLANATFSTGPSAGWSIQRWNEIK